MTILSAKFARVLRSIFSGVPLLLALTTAEAQLAPLDNKLKGHTSPYLELHADDPVQWQEWSPEVVERARAESKLIYVSSGYFSCHWCHVMQRQSFKNDDIARVLNEKYIPVKVDRELNSALDARLMDFAQATQGRGGWPLNAYLTPDGFPVYAHMYQLPEQFGDILGKLDEIWFEQRDRLTQLARDEAIKPVNPPTGRLDIEVADRYMTGLVTVLPDAGDELQGGFGDGPKFPMTPQLEFYLTAFERTGSKSIGDWLITTLDAIAGQGLRDHVGGGFYRYTTDPDWQTPHFEKMLYTNALLVRQFARAAKVLNRPDYADVAKETLRFMIREMQDKSGAMVASFSAVDDDDVEGGHYLWTHLQIDTLLKNDAGKLFKNYYGIDGGMPFESGYLPMRRMDIATAADSVGMSEDEARQTLETVRKQLYDARQARSLPVDTNLLAGWNGLALTAMAGAAIEFDDPEFTQSATAIRNFVMEQLWDGKRLKRASTDGKESGTTAVEDYAYVAEGLMTYARLTGKREDLELAINMTNQGFERYNRDNGWYLGETSLMIPEQTRPALEDGALPSPASVLARTARALADQMGDTPEATLLAKRAIDTLTPADRYLEINLFGFASYITAMIEAVHGKPKK